MKVHIVTMSLFVCVLMIQDCAPKHHEPVIKHAPKKKTEHTPHIKYEGEMVDDINREADAIINNRAIGGH